MVRLMRHSQIYPTLCNKRTGWRLHQRNIEENLNFNMSLKTEDGIERANKIIQESTWLTTPEMND